MLEKIRLIAILYVISIFISCDYYSQFHLKNELNYQISINVDTSVKSHIQENFFPGEELFSNDMLKFHGKGDKLYIYMVRKEF